MKNHIDHPDSPESSFDNPIPNSVEFRSHGGKQQARFHGLHNYINEALYDKNSEAISMIREVNDHLHDTWLWENERGTWSGYIADRGSRGIPGHYV